MNELQFLLASPGAMHHRHTPDFNTERAFEGALLHLSRAERREQRQKEAQRKTAQATAAIGHLFQPLTQLVKPTLRAAR